MSGAEADLLDRIRARLPHIDMLEGTRTPMPVPVSGLADIDLDDAQRKLDFALPPLLVRIWREVGNGGFGPAYGLMGLGPNGFTDDMGKSVDQLYRDFRTPDATLPTWQWPHALLPIATIGCAMYHCVDAINDRMMIWEPNPWDERAPLTTCIFVTGLSLFEWFDRWSQGDDVFPLIDGPEAQGVTLPRLIDLA